MSPLRAPRLPRRLHVALSAAIVPALVVGCDLEARGLAVFRQGGLYVVGATLSVLVWGLLVETARSRRRSFRVTAYVLIAGLAAFGVGLQAVVYSLTRAYLGRRALILALGIPHLGHAGYVTQNALRVGLVLALPALLAVVWTLIRAQRLGRRVAPDRAVPGGAALAIAVALLAPFEVHGVQSLPPDILLLNGVGGPLLYAVHLANRPKALPIGHHENALPLATPGPPGPAIVLIVGESLRRDEVCSARTPRCDKSPRLDLAAPERQGFLRGFSVASCTELASTALWTGLAVTTPPDVLARAPLVWDWAKARGYRTAYVTSQSLLFQQEDQFLRGSRIDWVREARDEIPDAPIDGGSPDEHTTAPALAFVEAPGAPAFVVVHHANTHVPYRQVPGFTKHPNDARGSYENALAYNDAVVADLVNGLRRGPRGRDAIVVFLSDHGEAFQDHGIAYHSFDLYAEQVDIPLWIDAPAGAWSEATAGALERAAATRPVTTYDVSATLIDLMGGLDDPALRAPASRLSGTSVFRELAPGRPVFLWNCPRTRECASEAFGVIAFPWKLHYVGREGRYACHDLEVDPTEHAPRPASQCADLRALLDRTFGTRGDSSEPR